MQTTPIGALMASLIDPATRSSPLQVLRLSRVPQDGLSDMSVEIEQNQAHDLAAGGSAGATPLSYAELAKLAVTPRPSANERSLLEQLPADARFPASYNSISSRRRKLQTFLIHLLKAIRYFPQLTLVLLELGELQALDPPPPPTQRFAHMQNATPYGEQFTTSTASFASSSTSPTSPTSAIGQLATLDFPTDIPLGFAEAQAWDQEEERRRTTMRDAYWMEVRAGKEALRDYANEQLERARQLDPEAEGAPTIRRAEDLPLDIRVVAPRPGGWNRFETHDDFQAQVAASSSSSSSSGSGGADQGQTADTTCFEDPDVFRLAEQRWELSYAPVPADDPSSPSSSYFGGARGKPLRYWTGTLPRIKATDGVVTPGGQPSIF